MFTYTKEEKFKPICEKSVNNCSEVTYIDISRDGKRISVLLPEPNNCLKIFDIKTIDETTHSIKEILSIP